MEDFERCPDCEYMDVTEIQDSETRYLVSVPCYRHLPAQIGARPLFGDRPCFICCEFDAIEGQAICLICQIRENKE